jgi:hypothetical protein
VLAYHSGEDRIVKERPPPAATGGCTCPPGPALLVRGRATGAGGRLLKRRAPGRALRRRGRGQPRAESARLRAAVLIKNQARIDDLNRRIDAATAETDTLALQVADLESPGRIIAVARERLGMIDPGSVTYLRPGGDDDARALLPAPPPPDPATPDPATPDPATPDPAGIDP